MQGSREPGANRAVFTCGGCWCPSPPARPFPTRPAALPSSPPACGLPGYLPSVSPPQLSHPSISPRGRPSRPFLSPPEQKAEAHPLLRTPGQTAPAKDPHRPRGWRALRERPLRPSQLQGCSPQARAPGPPRLRAPPCPPLSHSGRTELGRQMGLTDAPELRCLTRCPGRLEPDSPPRLSSSTSTRRLTGGEVLPRGLGHEAGRGGEKAGPNWSTPEPSGLLFYTRGDGNLERLLLL